jgi:cytochrome P450
MTAAGGPVSDWACDYDIFDEGYVADPAPVWADLRRRCPIARSERWGGSWMPTRYDDVVAMARMVPELSSRFPLVVPPAIELGPADALTFQAGIPPISSDPPEHGPARRLVLPAFSPQAVAKHEPFTRDLAHRLVDGFLARGRCDAAVEYAQKIPPRVIAHLLGLDEEMGDTFVGWVRGILEQGLTDPELRLRTAGQIFGFFAEVVAERRKNPGDDFISELLAGEVDGHPVTDAHAVGTCNLLLVAGIDTTWSSIGSALWHLATTPSDRRRLVEEPELMATAVEELLRAYSPVTMGRVVSEDVKVNGVEMHAGDRVLMNFPAANRDPDVFPDPDRVVLDRAHNRHVAFGVGIHRCAGSNLARMEMNVALSVFLERIPEFSLENPGAVTWCGGQVRGPRCLPLVFHD